MKKYFTYVIGLILVLFVTNCTPKEERPKPENLVSESTMIDMLTEICKVEARFQRRLSIKNGSNAQLVFHNYQVVFKEFNVDMDEFKTSYLYYEDSPEDMQNIYDSVIVRLTQQEAIYKSTHKEPLKE